MSLPLPRPINSDYWSAVHVQQGCGFANESENNKQQLTNTNALCTRLGLFDAGLYQLALQCFQLFGHFWVIHTEIRHS